jgi:hypothetical protein
MSLGDPAVELRVPDPSRIVDRLERDNARVAQMQAGREKDLLD